MAYKWRLLTTCKSWDDPPSIQPINVHFPLLVGGASHLKLYDWRTKSARSSDFGVYGDRQPTPRKSTAPPQKYKALLRAYENPLVSLIRPIKPTFSRRGTLGV